MSRVRLFAALRDLAGSAELEVDAADVGTLTKELAARYGEEFDRILAAGSVFVGDERADPSHPLLPQDEVALLPPVSGGGGEFELRDGGSSTIAVDRAWSYDAT